MEKSTLKYCDISLPFGDSWGRTSSVDGCAKNRGAQEHTDLPDSRVGRSPRRHWAYSLLQQRLDLYSELEKPAYEDPHDQGHHRWYKPIGQGNRGDGLQVVT